MSIGRRMVAGKQGMEVLQNDDTLSYVFYAPIKTGWSVATVCPRRKWEATCTIFSFIRGS